MAPRVFTNLPADFISLMSTARLQHAVGWGYAVGWALCLMLVAEPVFIVGSAWAQPGGGAGGMEAGGTAYYTFTVLRIFDIGR